MRPCRRYRRSCEAAARFVRLFSMGATLLALLVGLATAPKPATVHAVAWTILIGILFHVYADVSNDVIDLPIDRIDPRLMRESLVRGSISPQCALLLALLTLPLMLTVPFAADVIEGLGGSALVLTGAGLGGGWTTATLWAAGFAVTYIIMINGVNGAIRDAQIDTRVGARTTALLLGASIADGRRVIRPLWVHARSVILQAALGILLSGFLASESRSRPEFSWVVAAASSFGLYLASTVTLFEAHRRRTDLRAAMAVGTWHLFLVPASILAAATCRLPGWIVAVMVISFVVPPLLFRWAIRSTDFSVPSSTAVGGLMSPATRQRRQGSSSP